MEIYIAPLQSYYSEALPIPARPKRTELYISRTLSEKEDNFQQLAENSRSIIGSLTMEVIKHSQFHQVVKIQQCCIKYFQKSISITFVNYFGQVVQNTRYV